MGSYIKSNCEHTIGDEILCGLRNGKKVKFFVTDISQAAEKHIVVDVTDLVAKLLDRALTKDGWIAMVNAGYDPRDFLVEQYDDIMGRKRSVCWRIN